MIKDNNLYKNKSFLNIVICSMLSLIIICTFLFILYNSLYDAFENKKINNYIYGNYSTMNYEEKYFKIDLDLEFFKESRKNIIPSCFQNLFFYEEYDNGLKQKMDLSLICKENNEYNFVSTLILKEDNLKIKKEINYFPFFDILIVNKDILKNNSKDNIINMFEKTYFKDFFKEAIHKNEEKYKTYKEKEDNLKSWY